MKSRIRIYPYKQGSKGALVLAKALGGRVLKLEGSVFKAREGDLIINWGSSAPLAQFTRVLNSPLSIRIAADKAQFFRHVAETDAHLQPRIPRFSTTKEGIDWEGTTVVRHKLSGHSGEGIEIVEKGGEMPSAPLYVEYIPKVDEFRIHVMKESIISVQRKARRHDCENPNWKVRNHANGFNFVRSTANPNQDVLDQAITAVRALGLDFGAVDVIWNDKQQKAYVLEVNTAPGLEGQTVDDYVKGFKENFQ